MGICFLDGHTDSKDLQREGGSSVNQGTDFKVRAALGNWFSESLRM